MRPGASRRAPLLGLFSLASCILPGAEADLAPHEVVWEGGSLEYVRAGNPSGPTVLFVHGSPGSWSDWAGFLEDPALAGEYRLIAYDRPGYGGSRPKAPLASLANQARALEPLLAEHTILVGHSYGAPVALQAALDFPDRVRGIVLVSAALDPSIEGPLWIHHVGGWRPIRWLLPRMWDAANQELLTMASDLEQLESRWGELEVPVAIVHGARDWLADTRNVDYARRVLTATEPDVVVLEGASHFLPWTEPETVSRSIRATAERARSD